jgi:hypothetical protein
MSQQSRTTDELLQHLECRRSIAPRRLDSPKVTAFVAARRLRHGPDVRPDEIFPGAFPGVN